MPIDRTNTPAGFVFHESMSAVYSAKPPFTPREGEFYEDVTSTTHFHTWSAYGSAADMVSLKHDTGLDIWDLCLRQDNKIVMDVTLNAEDGRMCLGLLHAWSDYCLGRKGRYLHQRVGRLEPK